MTNWEYNALECGLSRDLNFSITWEIGDPFYQNQHGKKNINNIQSIHSVCAPQNLFIISKVIQKIYIKHNASCHEEEWGTNGQISLNYKSQYQIMISNQHHFMVTSHLQQELSTLSEQNAGWFQELVWAKPKIHSLQESQPGHSTSVGLFID